MVLQTLDAQRAAGESCGLLCTAGRSLLDHMTELYIPLICHLPARSGCCNRHSSVPTPVWHCLFSAVDCGCHRGCLAHSKLPLVLLLLLSGSSPSLTTLGLSGAGQVLPLTCSLLPSGDSSLLPSSTASSSSSGSLILSTSTSPVVSVMLSNAQAVNKDSDQHRANGRTQQRTLLS